MNDLVAPYERLLAGTCPPAVVRAIEAGGAAAPLWDAVEASGFLDALVPDTHGGHGLQLRDAFGLLLAEGRHAAPVPIGHTMLARALLALAGADVPRGPIAIAASSDRTADGVACRNTPYGMVAQWIVVPLADRWLLLSASAARRSPVGVHGSLHADLSWPEAASATHPSAQPAAWRSGGAVLAAAQLAGAMERVLAMGLQFANERVQFGRPIGKFQAIQHQLAVMAEHVASARMAAEIGCQASGLLPDALRAAVAKARASEAGAIVAPMAHAIHGAIGITAELDLQIFTRRIHELRATFGSEHAWHRVLGQALLAGQDTTLDFMRTHLLPSWTTP